MRDISVSENGVAGKVKQYCLENGLVCTSNRLLVASKLEELDRYEGAVSLWLLLKQERHPISINSVYLSLKLLAKAGLTSVRKTSSKQWEYRIKKE